MKTSFFLIMTILILLISNGLFFYFLKNKKPDTTAVDSLIVGNSQNSNKTHYMVRQLLQHMYYENAVLNDVPVTKINYDQMAGIEKTTPANIMVPVSSILQGEKVVFYFTLAACNSCVTEQLTLLHKLGKKIGKENIVLLTDLRREDMCLYMHSNKMNLSFYECGSQDIGLNQVKEVSSLLFLTSGNRITTSFVLDMDTKYYADSFYTFIESKFSNQLTAK